jgi:hypothetical protein
LQLAQRQSAEQDVGCVGVVFLLWLDFERRPGRRVEPEVLLELPELRGEFVGDADFRPLGNVLHLAAVVENRIGTTVTLKYLTRGKPPFVGVAVS